MTIASAASVEEIQSLIADEQLNDALRMTNEELNRDADNVNYQFLKGLILIRLNQLDQAETVFRKITTRHPELPEPYNNLAVIYAAMGDFDKARQALQEAINTHPSYATAHENMGDIYAKLASQAYNQALELDRANVTAKAKLSLINDLFSMPRQAKTQTVLADTMEEPGGTKEPQQPPQEAEPEDTGQPGETAAAPDLASQPAAGEPADDGQAMAEDSAGREARIQAVRDDIRATISAWAKAWSSQKVKEYLAHYGEEFTPPAGLTRSEWQQERRDRLSSPRFIRLDVSDLEVELLGDEHAQATFTQKYQSDTYSDLVTKLLLLVKKNDDWLIVQEATK